MFRLLAAAALPILSAPAFAQPLTPLTTASGVGGFGGRVRMNTPALNAPTVNMNAPHIRLRGGVTGGFVRPGFHAPGYPFFGVWGGFGAYPFFGYGYPYAGYPFGPAVVPVQVPVPVPVAVEPPQPPVALSGESRATLTVQLPAAAEVWVDGKKGEGEPTAEWTLTSPVLAAGGEYTFNVRARWKAGGKTYEYERSVPVAGGDRSRVLVVSGTEVRE